MEIKKNFCAKQGMVVSMWISELGKLRQRDHGLQKSLSLIQKTPAAECFIPI